MADGAINISIVCLRVKSRHVRGVRIRDRTVTFQAHLPDRTAIEHFRIGCSVRSVTGGASLGLERCMFVSKRPLLIAMAFNAACICSHSELDLLCFKSAMRVVTVAAFHRPFHDLVVERFAELGLRFLVAAHA